MNIRHNTLLNLAGSIIPIAVSLFTVPLYLDILGKARYGILALVWLILGYFALFDMGLGRAAANQIAKLHSASDEERASVFWTALSVNAIFGVLGALIFWVTSSFLLGSIFKMPDEIRTEVLAAIPMLIVVFPLALISSVLIGCLDGCERFFVVNVLQVITTLAFQIVPLSVAYWYNPSLNYVISAAVIVRAAMNIFFFKACSKYIPLKAIPKIEFARAKTLMGYGGWVTITGLLSPLLEMADRLLIGTVLGAQSVTYYTVPFNLITKVRILPSSLSRTLFPRFSVVDADKCEELSMNSILSISLIVTPLIGLGIIMITPFMSLWIDPDFAKVVTPIAIVLFVGIWINCLAHIPFTMLQGIGRPDLVAKFHAIEFFPFIMVMWFSLHKWGLTGAACIWSSRVIIDAGLLFWATRFPKRAIYSLIIPATLIILTAISICLLNFESVRWRIFMCGVFLLCWLIWARKGLQAPVFKRILQFENFRLFRRKAK
jgi:O-antigen/teichoic acid export membrane protein